MTSERTAQGWISLASGGVLRLFYALVLPAGVLSCGGGARDDNLASCDSAFDGAQGDARDCCWR